MNKTVQSGLTDVSKLLFATLICRVVFVVLVILTLPIRPTLPAWMLQWFGRISYPLLAYSIVSLIFHKKAGILLQKYTIILAIDLLISIGIISIGGSWRSSYFGYTFTSIILFTIFKGRRGAYGSALALSAVTVIKDPSGGLPALEVFFVSDWDMRMGGALIYITAGVILGYFHTLLQKVEALSAARVEETRKRTAIEEKTHMALELHDGAKQIVNAMLLKMTPLIKRIQSSRDEMADEMRWLWRGMNYLKSELNQIMDMLGEENPRKGSSGKQISIIEEEAGIAEVMTGFVWKVEKGSHEVDIPFRFHMPLRRLLSEARPASYTVGSSDVDYETGYGSILYSSVSGTITLDSIGSVGQPITGSFEVMMSCSKGCTPNDMATLTGTFSAKREI